MSSSPFVANDAAISSPLRSPSGSAKFVFMPPPPTSSAAPLGRYLSASMTLSIVEVLSVRGNIPQCTTTMPPSPAGSQRRWGQISGRPPPQNAAPIGGRLPLCRGVGSARLSWQRYTQPTRGCRYRPSLVFIEICPGPCWPGTSPLTPIPVPRYDRYECYRCRT